MTGVEEDFWADLVPKGDPPLRDFRPARSPDPRIIEFITTEGELADRHLYREWESLWSAERGLYWVCGPGDCDDVDAGFRQASFIFDNRPRIASRVRQLLTNRRISQLPASELSRVISNHRLAVDPDDDVVSCWVNFNLTEFRMKRTRTWAGRTLYRIEAIPSGLKLIEKRVILVDRTSALDTFTFIM